MSERAFVTGANGRIGIELVKYLSLKGVEVLGLARTPEKADFVCASGAVDCLVGDIYDQDLLFRGCKGVNTIYHLAGGIRGPGKETPDKLNREGTQNLLAAIEKAGNPEKIVFSSSCSVYGDRAGLWVSEDYQVSPNSSYGKSKVEAEKILLGAKGLDVRIARIGVVYGEGFPIMFLEALKKGFAWLPGEGENYLPIIHVSDCVKALVLIAEKGSFHSITNVATPNPVLSKDFYKEIAQRVGGKPMRYWSTYIPSIIQLKAASINERLSAQINHRPRFTKDMLRILQASVRLKVSPLKDELGFEWDYPDLKTGLDVSV